LYHNSGIIQSPHAPKITIFQGLEQAEPAPVYFSKVRKFFDRFFQGLEKYVRAYAIGFQ